MVFTSPRVGGLYFDAVRAGLERAGVTPVARHDVPDGEEHKSLEEYCRALRALLSSFPDPTRAPLVVNLGGGLLSDLGGFVAGTFRRGVPCVHVPTTLLACVDAGVGGKVAVNLGSVKNLVGLFHQPRLVFIDLATLKTLDARELRSGIAEVIKYGAVLSAPLFGRLERDLAKLLAADASLLRTVVAECCRLKARVVAADEFDRKGKRIALNFGHTLGHALEMAAEPHLTHGEAVAVGMVAAARFSARLGFCPETVVRRLRELISRAGLPVSGRGLELAPETVLRLMLHDKKAGRGKLRFVLPTRLGAWRAVEVGDQEVLREVVRYALE
jgi:3-dehydroquinate synthase